MVSKRRMECGFIAYDSRKVPRARRSVRKRSFCKETLQDGQLCAFELLAAVAGKLLQESDSSSASSNAAAVVGNHRISEELYKEEPQHHVNEVTKTEQEDQGSSEESGVSSSLCLRKYTKKDSHKEAAVGVSKEAVLQKISADSNYSSSAKVGFDVKPIIIHRSENDFNKLFSKTDGDSPKCGESFGPNVDNGIDRVGPCQDVNKGMGEVLGIADKFSTKDWVEPCGKLCPPIHSSSKADLAPGRGSSHDASFSKHDTDIKVDGRDDDDIISQLSDPCSQETVYGSPVHAIDRPIRKLSKNWKSAPKLRDAKVDDYGRKRNSISSGKSCCEHERFQHNTPFKKRKLLGQSNGMTHDGGIDGGNVSNSSGNRISSSSMGCQQSFDSASSHVKLSIKSFIVPELLIEVPEDTTVGSLKRAVMDAVTAALGGGLHVGVILHGKKICDDSRTLLQTGISENDNADDLGFVLEPCSSTQLPPDPPLPACQSPKDHVKRPLISKQELPLIEAPDNTSVTKSGESGRICQDLVPFSAPEQENKPISDSKALVPVLQNAESLDVVPMSPKLRRSEIGQRRIRRPFTVSEVEGLVQAVETLGTGRWRDVKLSAFENAKHRTYVDLKDKWKTLVHTARISPQQRRGEPVPQELLDRVLAAHGYWSQHQTRQQGKHQLLQLNQPGMLKISDNSPAEKVAA